MAVFRKTSSQITSEMMTVKNNEGEESRKTTNRIARTMKMTQDEEDGIPVIDGIRMPDDPNDTRVFRNAR